MLMKHCLRNHWQGAGVTQGVTRGVTVEVTPSCYCRRYQETIGGVSCNVTMIPEHHRMLGTCTLGVTLCIGFFGQSTAAGDSEGPFLPLRQDDPGINTVIVCRVTQVSEVTCVHCRRITGSGTHVQEAVIGGDVASSFVKKRYWPAKKEGVMCSVVCVRVYNRNFSELSQES